MEIPESHKQDMMKELNYLKQKTKILKHILGEKTEIISEKTEIIIPEKTHHQKVSVKRSIC